MQINFKPRTIQGIVWGKPNRIRLIIGLGNQTHEFENTYHNTGLIAADYLKGSAPKRYGNRYIEAYKIGNVQIIKPVHYLMNLSGNSVKAAMKYARVRKPEEIMIIHDDSDLNLGSYKISFGGGSAGHKGIASIIKTLGTENFWRLRIGIRNPEEKRRKKAGDFVLKPIKPSDQKSLEEVFQKVAAQLLKGM